MPLIEALSRHLEIGRISPALLQLVFQRSGSHQLKRLLADEHKTELKDWLWGRQPADLLRELQVDLGAQELVDCLKPLQPRLYSIASSPKVHPREVHLTVSTVRYERGGQPRSGCCSGFLADRAEGLEVPIFVQKSANFRPPADPQAPMIMVGPGTGIAPFRAFLQERQAIGASGKNWLFFGEQHAASDFYYREELQAWCDQARYGVFPRSGTEDLRAAADDRARSTVVGLAGGRCRVLRVRRCQPHGAGCRCRAQAGGTHPRGAGCG